MSVAHPKGSEVATLEPGQRAAVHRRGRAVHAINASAAEDVAVDGVAVRLAVHWCRFTLSPTQATGEVVIPWSRVDRGGIEDGP